MQPPGVRMLALIAAAMLAMKSVVLVLAGPPPLRPAQSLAFATLWPGMQPALFRHRASRPLPDAARLIGAGLLRAGLGAGAVLFARLIWTATGSRWLATAPLLVGLSLLLHFGLFTVLAGLWRRAGVDCAPLFRAPLAATSLAEFWARRWNLAFSEMTAAAVYRPLCDRIGRRAASGAAFLFSGLLHELAISVPVAAGYGLPSLYFALHGALVVLERELARRGTPIDRRAWVGRLWTFAWLAAPLPLLFHPAFLAGIVWPLIGMETTP
jgi:alginate O-acetyltransferase complex protein AlgI